MVLVVLQFTLSVVFLLYYAYVNVVSLALTYWGLRGVSDFVQRRPLRVYQEVAESPLSTPISILVPAYNEELTIVDSIGTLLYSNFANFNIIIINDGSQDKTVEQLVNAFKMVEIDLTANAHIPTQEVVGTYMSTKDSRIVLIDKVNGGKADALNTGINYARYPLVCCLDADTLLDEWALARIVFEFEADPTTVAIGGIVRVANGSTVQKGRLTNVSTPRGFLPNVQIVEYLRAFLGSRIGWSTARCLLIISGAFGVFKRETLLKVGGYDTDTVGEDAELVLRLDKFHRDHKIPYRIAFHPDPICWTEVPVNAKILSSQRDRWQRGLAQLLWRHKEMMFNPKYGRMGMITLPFFLIVELLGPVIELAGYAYVVLGFIFGWLWTELVLLITLISLTTGVVLTLLVIVIEQRAFARYPSWRDLWYMVSITFFESFGYRQYLAWVRAKALLLMVFRKTGWGTMTRKGFSETPVPLAED
ncbi:MAG: glycosyltransferase [Candidatus Nanopelagicales bacterium]